MRRASLAAAAAFAAALGSTSPADANGRFPESNQLVFSAEHPDTVLIRVTFGLLVSHDRGKNFEWVCEQSIGFSGVEDPMYTITPSKRYVGSTFQGVSVTRDEACGWSLVGGPLEGHVFIDLSANPNDGKHIVVFASSFDKQDEDGNALFQSRIWETKDEAETFQQLGGAFPPDLLGYTLDLTATDPDRIYVSAVRAPGTAAEGLLLTSRDHGQTWEEEPVPLESGERAVFIAAVDPNDAERVYLRTYNNSPDRPTRLILREAGADGGPPTLRTVYQASGALSGFALTPDGSRVFIGGPVDGIKAASTADFEFVQKSDLEVQCLKFDPDGLLWACSTERSGFIAGVSRDDGVTFEPRVRFCDIPGPLSCAPGSTTNDICTPLWPNQKALIGCGAPKKAADAGAEAPDAGDGGADTPKSSSGCGCRSAPAGPWGALAGAVALAATLYRRARRRR